MNVVLTATWLFVAWRVRSLHLVRSGAIEAPPLTAAPAPPVMSATARAPASPTRRALPYAALLFLLVGAHGLLETARDGMFLVEQPRPGSPGSTSRSPPAWWSSPRCSAVSGAGALTSPFR